MKTLTINDLSHRAELGRPAMAGVRGGMYKGALPYFAPVFAGGKHDFSVTAEQLNGQTQDISNNNGVNAVMVEGIRSTIKPTQSASNSLSF
ncbi:MAG: hypothetical protein ACM3X0_02725 [Bacteroidota bacterium]